MGDSSARRAVVMNDRWALWPMDCRLAMAGMMAAESVDSIVTDPPYDLSTVTARVGSPTAAPIQYGTDGAFRRAAAGFMGQQWDGTRVAFDPETWRHAWRVLKPGGYLIAFGGTRTYHRMACAIEDAGFEIRDCIAWVYGSGFPKSHDVSKDMDRRAGVEREIIGDNPNARDTVTSYKNDGRVTINAMNDGRLTAATSDEAKQWEGWGTALKPAMEPICVARKPLIDASGRPLSVAANVLLHGTGAINIDGCRVPTDETITCVQGGNHRHDVGLTEKTRHAEFQQHAAGRFPANFIHDGSNEVIALFPNGGARAPVHRRNGDKFRNTYGAFSGNIDEAGSTFQNDGQGSAARFFYCAKASKADREEGCAQLMPRPAGMVSENSGQHITRRDEGYEPPKRGNHHPTVKPTDLMRYLVRMHTPPGGLVFDPFTGSGSTGKAAMLEGFRFVGCEMTPEYIPIAQARIGQAALSSK